MVKNHSVVIKYILSASTVIMSMKAIRYLKNLGDYSPCREDAALRRCTHLQNKCRLSYLFWRHTEIKVPSCCKNNFLTGYPEETCGDQMISRGAFQSLLFCDPGSCVNGSSGNIWWVLHNLQLQDQKADLSNSSLFLRGLLLSPSCNSEETDKEGQQHFIFISSFSPKGK